MDRLWQCRFVVPPAQINLFPTIPVCVAPHSSQGRLVSDTFKFLLLILQVN